MAEGAGLRERVLLVFAKAPDPGRVKTRLARELGEDAAARVYRTLGRRVVDALRGGAYRMIVYFDPPAAEPRIRAWLGGGIELLGQPPGPLGERLGHAFEWGFARAGTVCVVGTDIPGLDRTVVEAAFEALEAPGGADAVFGPADDGGYYLLALARPAPTLFRDITWSTDRVFAESVEKAKEEGLAVEVGIPLADVDYAADVPESLRRELGLDRSRGGPGGSGGPLRAARRCTDSRSELPPQWEACDDPASCRAGPGRVIFRPVPLLPLRRSRISDSMTPPPPSSPHRQRLRCHSVTVETTPDTRCRVDVEVEWSPGTRIHGEGVGNATPEGMLIAGSMATLSAIQKVTRGLLELDFRGAKLVRAFDAQVVIVAVRGRAASRRYDLIGATAAPEHDLVRGAVLSVLDATNRILELYARPEVDIAGHAHDDST